MSQARVMAMQAANATVPVGVPGSTTPTPLLRTLPSWVRLTRYGVPQFRVVRRPLFYGGVTLQVGAVIPASHMPAQRVKQYYEQRLIAPIAETIVAAPPKGRPASEAVIPAQVLEAQALDAQMTAAEAEGMVETPFLADLPDIEMPMAEIEELQVPEVQAPQIPQASQAPRSKANKRQ